MKRKWKWIIWPIAAAAVVFFGPIIFTALTARGPRGYFDTGESIPGHGPIFVYLGSDQGFGYYSYCPGSGRRERLYQLRTRQPDSASQVPAPTTGQADFEAIREDGTVAFRLRTKDGQLYSTAPHALPQERWLIFTNYFRMGRVYNIWRVWIPSLSQGATLSNGDSTVKVGAFTVNGTNVPLSDVKVRPLTNASPQ